MKRPVLLMVLLVLGLLVTGVLYSTVRLARPSGPMYDLASERPARVFAARISIPTEYHACTEMPAPDSGTVPGVQCGDNGDIPTRLARLAAGRESLDPDSMQSAALALVLWGDTKESSLNEAIGLLEKASRLAPDRVSLLVDLSALYMARAERAQSPRDLTLALERALEAVRREPRNLAALYNVALASQALPLDADANARWNAYLARDSTSLWANEARGRRRALQMLPPALPAPTVSSTREEVHAFAIRHPQEARMHGWDTVLGQWGSAVLNDSPAHAASLLTLANNLGSTLERQGGDASLADAVRAIRDAQTDRTATIKLAQAHRAYAKGLVEQVLQLKPRSTVLIHYAEVSRVALMVGRHTSDQLKALSDSVRPRINTVHHPALTARLDWIVGKVLWDEGRFSEARERLHSAAQTYGELREAENYGATRAWEGWASFENGASLAAYQIVNQALWELRPYRSSIRLHSVLFDMAKYAVRDGMPLAAEVILNEALLVALQTRKPVEIAQALIAKEANQVLTGDTLNAAGGVDSAAFLIAAVADSTEARRLRSMRAVAEARHPAELNGAIAFFETDRVVWLMTALVRRAELHLAAGNVESASADLDSVTAHFWETSLGEKNFHTRTAVMEAARGLFDNLVMLHVEAGRPVEALRALERGRVSFAPGGDAQSPRGPLMSPRDQVALEYALIRDQLLVWMVRGRTVTLFRRTVDRDTVLYAIDQANAALESVERADQAEQHLQRLHNWLIRPVRDSLPLETKLVIVADGEIAGVPFAALFDAEGEKYLIEDHLLRFAATLAEAARPRQFTATPGRRPLLIADPEFDRKEHSTLNPLSGARTEIDSLLQFYPRADTLSGTNATVDALRTRAPRASVIHYAGHAIFDDTRPERSFLVLAGSGRLAADTVGSMDLRGVRMVVLSACRTLRARQGRSGGFAGLSGALLNAGAGGVVGSLWKVDDDLAQPLMVAFHREYQRESDPAQALRTAQLEMLASDDNRKSPAAWAGFRYVGR